MPATMEAMIMLNRRGASMMPDFHADAPLIAWNQIGRK
jgi:hypothetical protein